MSLWDGVRVFQFEVNLYWAGIVIVEFVVEWLPFWMDLDLGSELEQVLAKGGLRLE